MKNCGNCGIELKKEINSFCSSKCRVEHPNYVNPMKGKKRSDLSLRNQLNNPSKLEHNRKAQSKRMIGKFVGELNVMKRSEVKDKHLTSMKKVGRENKEYGKLNGEKNGMFGSKRVGELNPMFGKKQPESAKKIIGEKNSLPKKNIHCKCCEKEIEVNINSKKKFCNMKCSKEFVRLNPEFHPNYIMAQKGFVSKPQMFLFKQVEKLFENQPFKVVLEHPVKTEKSTFYIDVAVPGLHLGFEYDEPHWHQNKVKDEIRKKELEKNGWHIHNIVPIRR